MSRWTIITEDHLRAAGHGSLIDAARATPVGAIDPVASAIADATARVRRAVSTGNSIDADPAKVPNSLKGPAIRLAIAALSSLIGFVLEQDLRDAIRADNSDLNRISDNKIKVELPDDPAGSGEMQATGGAVAAINVPCRQTGRERTSGL